MPTPSEQKALAFVAIVILLGGAVRVLRAGSATPTENEQQGIARQAHASDSAAASQSSKSKGKARGRKPRTADTLPHVVGGVASVPPTYARPDQPFAKSPYGYPPPGPRIDIDARPSKAPASNAPATRTAAIDIEHATADEIEKLPRIGPAMARRIVANRDSFGAFKSPSGLRRVKGVGPATLERLTPLIRFGASP